jgi:hypothetical protein
MVVELCRWNTLLKGKMYYWGAIRSVNVETNESSGIICIFTYCCFRVDIEDSRKKHHGLG